MRTLFADRGPILWVYRPGAVIRKPIRMRIPVYKASTQDQRDFGKNVRKNVHAYFTERNLSTKGNLGLAVKVFVMLFLYLGPLVVMVTVPLNIWWGLLCALVMGVGMAGLGMSVMHDGVHGACSRHQWVNNLLGGSMYLMGSSVLTWRIQHNGYHHTHTNINHLDGDLDSRGPLRFSEHAPLKPVHRFQHRIAFFIYGLLTITKLVLDFATLTKFNREGETQAQKVDPRSALIGLTLIKVLYLGTFLALPLVFSTLAWWEVLLCFVVTHFVASVIMGTVFQLAHIVEEAAQPLPNEANTIPMDWTVHELHTTVNFSHGNRLLGWYIGGLNFQIEHHLFPHICHMHYRKIAPIVERTAREHGIPYYHNPSLWGALVSHVRRLKALGRPALAMA